MKTNAYIGPDGSVWDQDEYEYNITKIGLAGINLEPDPLELFYAEWIRGRSGEWLVYGPLAYLRLPGAVRIKKKDGTFEHRKVFWCSKPFDVDGVPHCYAKAEDKRPCASCGGMHLRNEVRYLIGRNIRFVPGEKDCDCGGKLAKMLTVE